MKLLILKLGSRISYNSNDTSGGNGEARSLINVLYNAGANIHIFTKIIKNDNLVPHLNWHDILEEYNDIENYDALVIINGSVNFFGGAEDRSQILNYHIIQNFNGPIFYFHCDPALKFNQIWQSIESKSWGSAYNKNDIFITKKPIVITQQYNIDEVHKLYQLKNSITPSKIIHYPFEQFPMLLDSLEINENPLYDLSYGGTLRNGKREDNIIKFYFDYPDDIDVNLFGKIQAKNFKSEKINNMIHPSYSGPVKYSDMLPRMNMGLAHVVIGDKQYSSIEMLNQRIYESINSSVVTFIDIHLDKNKRVYSSNSFLCDFLYVENRDQVIDRIRMLKNNPTLRKEIIKKQFNCVNFQKTKYCKDLYDIIKNNGE